MAEMLLDQKTKEAAREHNSHIADNYRNLMDALTAPDEKVTLSPVYERTMTEAMREKEPAAEPVAILATVEAAPETASETMPAPASEVMPAATPHADAASRIDDYFASTVYDRTAHGAEGYHAYVVTPAATSTDDAAPTPQTMDTILRPAASEAHEAEGVKTGFFAALSTRMKTALICITLAVVVAIALVIINTGIINSIDSTIANKQMELDRVIREARQIENKIQDATDPDTIDEWAQQEGMIFGN